MLLEMGLIVGGVPFGWMGRKSERVIALVGRGLTWSVRLMLFLLGLSLGADATLVARMRTLGLRAAVISTLSVLGCVVAAWALGRFVLADTERGSVSSGKPRSQSPYSGEAPGKTSVDGTAESGIGGSLLMVLLPKIQLVWYAKLPLAYVINVMVTVVFVCLLSTLYWLVFQFLPKLLGGSRERL